MIPKAEQRHTEELLDNIPEELRRRRQWVTWSKPDKIPHIPGSRARASSTDSETWRSFEEALADVKMDRRDGVGFVFSSGDPYTGIDLDGCRDPETGEVDADAWAIVEALDGYTEVSPSGKGLHIIVRGKLPGPRNRKGRIEAYSSERFFTMTGVQP